MNEGMATLVTQNDGADAFLKEFNLTKDAIDLTFTNQSSMIAWLPLFNIYSFSLLVSASRSFVNVDIISFTGGNYDDFNYRALTKETIKEISSALYKEEFA